MNGNSKLFIHENAFENGRTFVRGDLIIAALSVSKSSMRRDTNILILSIMNNIFCDR